MGRKELDVNELLSTYTAHYTDHSFIPAACQIHDTMFYIWETSLKLKRKIAGLMEHVFKW